MRLANVPAGILSVAVALASGTLPAADPESFCPAIGEALSLAALPGTDTEPSRSLSFFSLLARGLPPGAMGKVQDAPGWSTRELESGQDKLEWLYSRAEFSRTEQWMVAEMLDSGYAASIHAPGRNPPLIILSSEQGTDYCMHYSVYSIIDGKGVPVPSAGGNACRSDAKDIDLVTLFGRNVIILSWQDNDAMARSDRDIEVFEVRDLDANPPGSAGCRGKIEFRREEVARNVRTAPISVSIAPYQDIGAVPAR